MYVPLNRGLGSVVAGRQRSTVVAVSWPQTLQCGAGGERREKERGGERREEEGKKEREVGEKGGIKKNRARNKTQVAHALPEVWGGERERKVVRCEKNCRQTARLMVGELTTASQIV